MDTLIRPTVASRLSDLYWRGVWQAKKLSPWVDTQALLTLDLRPLWTDVSANQGAMNVGIMALNGVQGIVGRAGISYGYPDPSFPGVWVQAGDAGIYRTSYHVIYTDQPVISQADNWYAVHPERDIVPRWIDLEVDRGDFPGDKAEATWEMVELVERRDGIPPTIYSRYLLVNAWLAPYWSEWQMNHVTWALAQYKTDRTVEHPGPPTLPNKVNAQRALYHQTADKIPGWPGSIESSALDRDRWLLGSEQQMHSYIHNNWGGIQEPEPEPEPEPPQEPSMIIRVDEIKGSKTGVDGWSAYGSPAVPDGEFWTLEYYRFYTNEPVRAFALDILNNDGEYQRVDHGVTFYGQHIKTLGVTLKTGEKFRIGSSGTQAKGTISWYVRVRVEKAEL